MPVPFPPGGQAKVGPPDAAEARLIAGGVAAAVETAGGLTSLQRVMIEAVTESMTGFVVPLSVLPRLGPDEFAQALIDRDELFRSHMLRFMLLCALVLNPLPEEVVDRVDVYARELGVENDMLRVAAPFCPRQLRSRARRLPTKWLHGDLGPESQPGAAHIAASWKTRGKKSSATSSSPSAGSHSEICRTERSDERW